LTDDTLVIDVLLPYAKFGFHFPTRKLEVKYLPAFFFYFNAARMKE